MEELNSLLCLFGSDPFRQLHETEVFMLLFFLQVLSFNESLQSCSMWRCVGMECSTRYLTGITDRMKGEF